MRYMLGANCQSQHPQVFSYWLLTLVRAVVPWIRVVPWFVPADCFRIAAIVIH